MTRQLLLLALAGLGAATAPDAVLVKVTGDPNLIAGIVVDGKDYAPVETLAAALGAKAMPDHNEAGQRQILITPGAVVSKGFDDAPDTVVPTETDTPTWQMVSGSHNHIRIHDFIRDKDQWTQINEIEVAPETILVQGRVPRDKMTLRFYVTGKSKDGKTLLRALASVKNVSYEGGRFPISISGYYGASTIPSFFTIRFNSAEETTDEPPAGGG